MRDKLKSKEYFEEFIKETLSLIKEGNQIYEEGKIPNDRIKWYRYGDFEKKMSIISALYSLNEDLYKIKKYYLITLKDFPKVWSEEITKIKSVSSNEIIILDQYMVSSYFLMLQMLSLGYLFNISDQDFQILIDVIDNDNISDDLYEFIIKARFPDRLQKYSEKYDKEESIVLKKYDNLRKAVKEDDRTNSALLITKFLKKDFYNKHSNFYEFHKKRYSIYYGYWSFEASVVVSIKELNDHGFVDNQYYPKDIMSIY